MERIIALAVSAFGLGAAVGCGGVVDEGGTTPEESTATSAAGLTAPSVLSVELGSIPTYPIHRIKMDLIPDVHGYLRYGTNAYSNIDYFYVPVVNVGEADFQSQDFIVNVGGSQWVGFTQRGPVYDPAKVDNVIPGPKYAGDPNARGVIVFFVNHGMYKSGSSYPVHLDVSHNQQQPASAYDNDDAVLKMAARPRYDDPFTDQMLGYQTPDTWVGHTMGDVVSSVFSARQDTLLCSHCHYEHTTVHTYYQPEGLRQDGSARIDRNQVVSGNVVWAGQGGWASRFVLLSPSPHTVALNELFTRWLTDGSE